MDSKKSGSAMQIAFFVVELKANPLAIISMENRYKK